MASSNPPGYIPTFGQGIEARDKQYGVSGGKGWLKAQKLHKYWPTFSHWSYSDIMSLTDDNIDSMIEKTGSSGMTTGAKGRLLRCIDNLRTREETIKSLPYKIESGQLTVKDALDYVLDVIDSPLPIDLRESLPTSIVITSLKVIEHVKNVFGPGNAYDEQLLKITSKISRNFVLRRSLTILESGMKIREESSRDVRREAIQDTSIPDQKCSRIRQLSGDSGFDETEDDWYKPSDITWPTGKNTVMFVKWENPHKEEVENCRALMMMKEKVKFDLHREFQRAIVSSEEDSWKQTYPPSEIANSFSKEETTEFIGIGKFENWENPHKKDLESSETRKTSYAGSEESPIFTISKNNQRWAPLPGTKNIPSQSLSFHSSSRQNDDLHLQTYTHWPRSSDSNDIYSSFCHDLLSLFHPSNGE